MKVFLQHPDGSTEFKSIDGANAPAKLIVTDYAKLERSDLSDPMSGIYTYELCGTHEADGVKFAKYERR